MPEPTQVNDLPRVATEAIACYTRYELVKPAFCPTRHSGCEQLAHSCYIVIGFNGIRTRVFETRVERAIHSANNHMLSDLRYAGALQKYLLTYLLK